MKFLINTSNLYVGGSAHVALSFINELKQINKEYECLGQKSYPGNFLFYLIEKLSASSKTRKTIVAKLDGLEKQIEPNIVFTIFGPSYW